MYIFNLVAMKYRRKVFYEDNFLTWCARVETEVIPDVDLMTPFEDIPIEVTNNMLQLPCNLFKLEDVYDDNEEMLSYYNNNGFYLYNMKDKSGNPIAEGSTIHLNYEGTNIDLKTGTPLCAKGHEFICETFCKLQAFEEDVSLKNFSSELYGLWLNSLSGLVAAAKQDIYQHKTRQDNDRITVIKGNMIPMIGNLPLKHKQFIS
jgi:hypothetical protein